MPEPVRLTQAVARELFHAYTQASAAVVRGLEIKHRRRLFAALRRISKSGDYNHVLLNCHGMTTGEFCTFQIIVTDMKRAQSQSTNRVTPLPPDDQ